MAVNTMKNFKHAYPLYQPFDKKMIVKWLGDVIKKKFDANYVPEVLQSVNTLNDKKLYKTYLKRTIAASYNDFD